MTSPNLALPYLAAAQAQKHVTVNEALDTLDGLVQLSVISASLAAPPGSPVEGDRYIIASGATGAWAGWDASVAQFSGGAWHRLIPQAEWLAWDAKNGQLLVWTGSAWTGLNVAMGLLTRAASVWVAQASAGSATDIVVAEELLPGLSGTSATSAISIPNRAIVLGVSTRTVTAITGATSFDCGISGEAAKFGGSLGIAAGSTNVGVIGPQAFYAATPIILTANGGNFTGGAVRLNDASFVRMPENEFEAMLARAAEQGARRALADVGLDGPEAAIDIHDLRTLLESLRMARRTAWQTIIRLITTGLLLTLIAGIAVKLKLFG